MSKAPDGQDPDGRGAPPTERPRSVVSLLGQPRGERADERPERDGAGGADPLRSEHSTFRDLEAPRDDFDPERARAVCAEIARDALRDFAPALVLLPAPSRARAQALLAYARTLLDFARDRTLEGERLAQINRFEFALEAALGGQPPGQPVFVQMAALESQEAWAREAFDELASVARSRVTVGLPKQAAAAEAQRRRLARAALHALTGAPPADDAVMLGAALLRAASLAAWHDALWYHRPDLGLGADDAPSPRFAEVVAAESGAIVAALEASSGATTTLPERLRPAARYAALAAAALARRAAARPNEARPPRLSARARLWLLLSARLARRRA